MRTFAQLVADLNGMGSPYVPIDGWEPGEPYDGAICPVCLFIFPPDKPGAACPRGDPAELLPVAFRP